MFHQTPSAPKSLWACASVCSAAPPFWPCSFSGSWLFFPAAICMQLVFPEGGSKIPSGEVFLSTIQLLPTQRFPITFVDVTVQDTVSREPLSPELCLCRPKKCAPLMSSSWRARFGLSDRVFRRTPSAHFRHHPYQPYYRIGHPLVCLSSPEPPTEYTIRYRLFGIFPKTERLVFHWDTGESEAAYPPQGPLPGCSGSFSECTTPVQHQQRRFQPEFFNQDAFWDGCWRTDSSTRRSSGSPVIRSYGFRWLRIGLHRTVPGQFDPQGKPTLLWYVERITTVFFQ